MGGMGDSGIGRRHGHDGIVKYTDTQSVVRQRGHPLAAPAGVPNWLAARALVALAKLRRYVP
jgi:succinate-semialdehyde dehydrogenase/glutarate-semialdehyde dehydrogenase